jgi:hypothetical protein
MDFHYKSATYQPRIIPSKFYTKTKSTCCSVESVRFPNAPRRISDPPDKPAILPPRQEKTAGRAVTLRGGAFDSLAATLSYYDIIDSCASAKSAGGAI